MSLKEAFIGRQPSHFKVNPFVRAFIVAESFMWSALNLSSPIFGIFIANEVSGGNVETAAMSFTVYYVTRVFAELITGRKLQESGDAKKFRAVFWGIIITGISYLGFAYAGTIALLYFFQGLSGVGLGVLTPPKNALFSTHLDKNREAAEWGIYDATVFVGMGLSAALGGFMAERYGFKLLFFVTAIIVWLTIIPYQLYFKTAKRPVKKSVPTD